MKNRRAAVSDVDQAAAPGAMTIRGDCQAVTSPPCTRCHRAGVSRLPTRGNAPALAVSSTHSHRAAYPPGTETTLHAQSRVSLSPDAVWRPFERSTALDFAVRRKAPKLFVRVLPAPLPSALPDCGTHVAAALRAVLQSVDAHLAAPTCIALSGVLRARQRRGEHELTCQLGTLLDGAAFPPRRH